MSTIVAVWQWLARHELALWILGSAVLLPILRTRTPAQWVAMAERHPRAQGLVRAMRGAGFDPAKVLDGLIQAFTGKARRAAELKSGDGLDEIAAKANAASAALEGLRGKLDAVAKAGGPVIVNVGSPDPTPEAVVRAIEAAAAKGNMPRRGGAA